MKEYTARHEVELQALIGELRQLHARTGFLRVKAENSRRRSLSQNDMQQGWYEQIARERPEDSKQGWIRYCKLHHGVPLLRAESSEFKTFYDSALLGLTYEQKLQAMDFVPVTSLMTTEQHKRYLDALKVAFGPLGVRLRYPDEAA